MGRHRPARLHRPPARLVEGRAAPRRDAGPTGAVRPAAGLGRRTPRPTALALEPLRDDAMRELLAGFVPGPARRAVEAILGRADGIPLYAVETVRTLVAEAARAVDGAYRPVGDLGELAVPETLRSLIASRLDALDPADRSLVQDASVLGQTFTRAALAALAGLTPRRARAPPARRSSGASCSTSRSIRARRSAASTASSSRSSARSPTARSPGASAQAATWRRPATSRRSATTSWRAPWPPTTSPPTRRRPRAPRLMRSPIQARLALRGGAERAAALGGRTTRPSAVSAPGDRDHDRTCWSVAATRGRSARLCGCGRRLRRR